MPELTKEKLESIIGRLLDKQNLWYYELFIHKQNENPPSYLLEVWLQARRMYMVDLNLNEDYPKERKLPRDQLTNKQKVFEATADFFKFHIYAQADRLLEKYGYRIYEPERLPEVFQDYYSDEWIVKFYPVVDIGEIDYE